MSKMHASVVSINGKAVLLRGPSGVGKSDLSLRLIEGGAELVSDDYVDLRVKDGRLLAEGPKTILGMMEVRGLGLISMPYIDHAEVHLACDLMPASAIERLPDTPQYLHIEGLDIPLMQLDAMAASAPARIKLALKRMADIWPDPQVFGNDEG
ncbi:MAG: HPr kinase/phosphatase C-terminal domain-containing protein [Sneathiella sp.]